MKKYDFDEINKSGNKNILRKRRFNLLFHG